MSEEFSPDAVAAVVVTYGNRFDYLHKVVAGILENGIGRTLIVDNASPVENRQRIDALCAAHADRVSCLRLPENSGSAGGFGAGMAAAAAMPGVEFVWLFDDDNRPLPDAFAKLCLAYRYLGSDAHVALVSLRPSRRAYAFAALNGTRLCIRLGTFMDFSFSEWIKRKIKRAVRRLTPFGRLLPHEMAKNFRAPLLRIELAPYGGLLFHTRWLSEIGLPDKKLYLYNDDHDFALRLQSAGVRIYLCAESKLEELEPSWPGPPSRIPLLMRPQTDEMKIYCLIRNRAYIEARLPQPQWRYGFNRVSFFLVNIALALCFGAKWKTVVRRWHLMSAAVRAARLGRFDSDSSGRPIFPVEGNGKRRT